MPSSKHHFGWEYNPREVEAFVAELERPIFGVSCYDIKDSGKGKIVLLHKYVEQAAGQFPVRRQTIGDCVSHGWACAIDCIKAVEIALFGEAERWTGITATEPIYGSSRVEIGGGRLSGDGSYGGWAAKAVSRYGTVVRDKFGSIDLRRYSGQRARSWGRSGVPDELEPKMREHKANTVSMVRSYEEARDAIANGYPVPVCSMQGFSSKRDRDGFARPSGSWAHCMCFIAVDDKHGRPGLLCNNSWGPNWISGPKRHGQPDGSFWVDADVCDRMLGRNPDSYAVSNFDGYPSQELDHFLI